MDREQLVTENINLVYSVIHKYYPTFIKDEDLIQVGRMGLCRAANNWIEEKGTFTSFAWQCIRNEIRNEFRSRNKVPETISLETKVNGKDGSTIELCELLPGESDIGYLDVDSLYSRLTPREQSICELRQLGLNTDEIASTIGCCAEVVRRVLRRIKRILNDERK